MYTMKAIATCGAIKSGTEYRVLGRGLDWYKIKVRGKTYFASNWVFDTNPMDSVRELLKS